MIALLINFHHYHDQLFQLFWQPLCICLQKSSTSFSCKSSNTSAKSWVAWMVITLTSILISGFLLKTLTTSFHNLSQQGFRSDGLSSSTESLNHWGSLLWWKISCTHWNWWLIIFYHIQYIWYGALCAVAFKDSYDTLVGWWKEGHCVWQQNSYFSVDEYA